MKTITLKVDGDEKVKFRLIFEYDEVRITLLHGGNETKYTDTLTIGYRNGGVATSELNFIADTIQKLYTQYLMGKETENELVEMFEDKKNIELKVL